MIFRVKKDKDNPYVMINKAVVHDRTLSFKAKGILLYLLSRPDNWVVHEWEILKHATDGRDSVRTGIRELERAGYIARQRIRDEQGRLRESEYTVYEVPKNQLLETKDGFSYIGKPDTTNIEYTESELIEIFSRIDSERDRQELFKALEHKMIQQESQQDH